MIHVALQTSRRTVSVALLSSVYEHLFHCTLASIEDYVKKVLILSSWILTFYLFNVFLLAIYFCAIFLFDLSFNKRTLFLIIFLTHFPSLFDLKTFIFLILLTVFMEMNLLFCNQCLVSLKGQAKKDNSYRITRNYTWGSYRDSQLHKAKQSVDVTCIVQATIDPSPEVTVAVILSPGKGSSFGDYQQITLLKT